MQNCNGLSVIIPVLNEAQALPRLLDQLRSQTDVSLDIIVADGGSTDGSIEIARRHPVRLLQTERGRAKQLNRGAALAKYDQLLFLHADSGIRHPRFLATALRHWIAYRRHSHNEGIAGHFKLCFETGDSGHPPAFRYLEAKSASNRPQTINGDQGLLIGKEFFQSLGGYNERLAVMEDQEIAHRIVESGEWMLLTGTLFTSPRRFEIEGFHRRYILMGMMMACYWSGIPEFFNRAGEVYPSQQDARKLQLWPFFKAFWLVMLRDLGFKRSIVQSYRLGRYARENAWQFFFFIDVLRRATPDEASSYPFTQFYDRFLHRTLDNRLADLLATPVVIVWYLFVLGPIFYFLDRE